MTREEERMFIVNFILLGRAPMAMEGWRETILDTVIRLCWIEPSQKKIA